MGGGQAGQGTRGKQEGKIKARRSARLVGGVHALWFVCVGASERRRRR